jgi:hypothetical protein
MTKKELERRLESILAWTRWTDQPATKMRFALREAAKEIRELQKALRALKTRHPKRRTA